MVISYKSFRQMKNEYATVLKELSEEYFKDAERVLDEYRKGSQCIS